jgi:hypothetical protein
VREQFRLDEFSEVGSLNRAGDLDFGKGAEFPGKGVPLADQEVQSASLVLDGRLVRKEFISLLGLDNKVFIIVYVEAVHGGVVSHDLTKIVVWTSEDYVKGI